ncbi:MAG: glucose-1-phosphate adenylyltransferase [Oscillospiraceae bacterium]|nr:glucose-1-phosphate adenylyltransferase [Oscillospiraceae bacterium]MBR2740048.1 glucose-1-phosphate adenylyltransferase [Oscillospiraceae bacterium]
MKECVAMLLAGGQGSRLYALTQNIAKPAVPYGGKYRIIDFPLSNCTNSGIDTVGVLTQYQPLELNEYIGNGRPWDLDRLDGGVHVLPPYQKSSGSDWYLGTANAICQNIRFIDRYDPQYVLILSGDHIYKMDYRRMLDVHKASHADCTISVMKVPMEEASRFGIMNADENDIIYEFEEKPKNPKSDLASMGIYIFSWDVLREYLLKDDADPDSEHDFGKNVIPAILNDGKRLKAYRFEGYWKDVGTIASLWDANMDLLNPSRPFDVWAKENRIYSRPQSLPPHFIAEGAKVENSLITEGSQVFGEVESSVLFGGAYVEEGAEVSFSLLLPGARVKKGAKVRYSIIAENSVVGEGASVGASPEEFSQIDDWGIAVVGPGLKVGRNADIKANAMIYDDVQEGEVKC